MKKTIKKIGIILSLSCMLLTGCGGNVDKSGNSNEAGNDTKGELSVYCMENDAKVDQYISEFNSSYNNVKVTKRAFDDSNQMDELVKGELNSGKGPDVIIFPSGTRLDVLGMAKSGSFAALDDQMKGDTTLKSEDYLPGAFEAGKVDGKQYVLPLTFRIHTVTYDSKTDSGFTPSPVITYNQLMSSLETSIERLKDDKDHGAITFTSLFGALLSSSQVVNLSFDNQSTKFDDNAIKKAVDVAYLMQQQYSKIVDIMTVHGGTPLSVAERFAYIYDNQTDLTHGLWQFVNFYKEAGAGKMGHRCSVKLTAATLRPV